MEEHGVSKIVSVKFHKADEPAENKEGTRALVPPPTNMAPIAEEEDAKHKKEDTIEVAMAK
jgi:hypothetical protein